MENLIAFANDNLDYRLLFIIVLAGYFIVRYTAEITIVKDVYKVLIASLIASVIFYFLDGCGKECLIKYFFTYLFATSFYELILKSILDKFNLLNKKK